MNETSNPPAQTLVSDRHRIDELVRLATGLCVPERDFDRLSRWTADRSRVLARRMHQDVETGQNRGQATFVFRQSGI